MVERIFVGKRRDSPAAPGIRGAVVRKMEACSIFDAKVTKLCGFIQQPSLAKHQAVV